MNKYVKLSALAMAVLSILGAVAYKYVENGKDQTVEK